MVQERSFTCVKCDLLFSNLWKNHYPPRRSQLCMDGEGVKSAAESTYLIGILIISLTWLLCSECPDAPSHILSLVMWW